MPRNAPRPNRSDLQVPATASGPGQPNGLPQAIKTPTGLPYGEAGQLQQSQSAVPLPQSPTQPISQQDAMGAAKNFQMPNLGDLHGPTQRPNEPVQAGLPGGPGAPAPPPNNGIGAMLSRMATAANSPALAQLAARATSLQQ